jgi:hypothetical protein
MDLNELLKAAPHLQSIATTIVAGVPLAEIVKRIVLPSADVLGKRMSDRVERCFVKTAKMIEDAGVTPQPVEDKLVVEILRGASLEEDEDLHTMWAALLANASDSKHDVVLPSFVAVLRQLSSRGALFLDAVYNRHREYLASGRTETEFVVGKEALLDIYYQEMPSPETVEIFSLTVEDLQRIGLLGAKLTGITTGHADLVYPNFEPRPTQAFYGYHLTDYGLRFVVACSPPKPK